MTAGNFDIQELITQSGVPRRTIYFYVQQGVLPPPEGAGLAAHYSEDHLLRLRLIPLLRQQGLRLDEIRARFTQMSADEMRRLVKAGRPGPAAPLPVAPPPPVVTPQEVVGPQDKSRATREPAAGWLPGVAVGWGEQRCIHYELPGGITLVAPENLGRQEQQRLQQLLAAARQIFSGSPFVYLEPGNSNAGQSPAASKDAGDTQPPEEE